MFCDDEYINEKVDELKDMIKNDAFEKDKSNNFISFDDLEDEYSHNDIEEAQQSFIAKAKEYLSTNHSGKYAIWFDWCVHITTVDFYRKVMWENNNYRKEYRRIREKRDIIV